MSCLCPLPSLDLELGAAGSTLYLPAWELEGWALLEGWSLGDRSGSFSTWCGCGESPPPCLTPLPTFPVSDLAPGQSGMDDMKLLEQRAEQLAAEAEHDQPPRAQSKILFVR